MNHTLNIQHLPPSAIHSLMTHLPDYVKVALMEKATQLECSLEAAIEMAIASFLDSEAFSFEDCLLSQRLQESELVESSQRK
ncbi:MAG: hypothetical protein JGK24_17515 [Microcoleus sp. PH2017_29_MFU_D_A]|jgi:hypothetical protein|uniref:hypothetical protein n=1 Tax=unclassified Microcoleus TaxID=2642155 RepID=UPI001DA43361|nr:MULTISPECIES: hypothetical protein [unclassified Microcoleus]MCC3432225.1 hypothetical protein [Microcoleus sp. PH2017_04_SCI_O_A]MCC3468332.1 hypothetical protein [Microcoleus sp. PH2017_06_SFM_O_A]MCC3504516.1 hypothetical protein [Microcoleus sp. PH2017_19_SFW_U_A]TAG63959.1 MAG: hypothetical protein EAZ25_22675 [Oscillatoriales cyanobacterium]MCC3414574.1 hypothetical protein [Microcoleus sp. PH2017_02_FOX_O_A]